MSTFRYLYAVCFSNLFEHHHTDCQTLVIILFALKLCTQNEKKII